ncbi:uncharacterized protein PAC_01356 [Phialocephala subalpina]|uniref:Uncharacterized protein n=1 Tax=Phialocephala subalpina TaxID=576137 RepID=A0A1L7WFC4_9HELO|nr:uncharacterized protein PAC_01356 [Phialocephala subalpina]
MRRIFLHGFLGLQRPAWCNQPPMHKNAIHPARPASAAGQAGRIIRLLGRFSQRTRDRGPAAPIHKNPVIAARIAKCRAAPYWAILKMRLPEDAVAAARLVSGMLRVWWTERHGWTSSAFNCPLSDADFPMAAQEWHEMYCLAEQWNVNTTTTSACLVCCDRLFDDGHTKYQSPQNDEPCDDPQALGP